MRSRPTRRSTLKQLGLMGLSSLGLSAGVRAPRNGGDLLELGEALGGAADRAAAFEVAVAAIRAGTTPVELLGATFLAGVQDISPRPVGNALHSVLMVESSMQLAEASPTPDAWRIALWVLDYLKTAQTLHRHWHLGPRPAARIADAGEARAELVRGLEDWDDARTDQAITSLVALADQDTVFDVLWPYVGRSSLDLGHKSVYGAAADRILTRIGWRYAEPVLRALTRALLHSYGNQRWDRAQRLARAALPELEDRWEGGAEDPDGSAELLAALRSAPASEAPEHVVAAFAAGLGPRTVWDGLQLFAHDVNARRSDPDPTNGPAIGPLHAVTALNGHAHAFRRARDPATRALIVLTAAGWVGELRDQMEQRPTVRLRDSEAGLHTLEPREDPGIDALFAAERPTPSQARAFLGADATRAEVYAARLRHHIARSTVESHQHKFAAALFEDAARVHPRWRADLLAFAVPYLPNARTPADAVLPRSERALRDAGVL